MKTIHAHYSETIESLKLEINRLNQRILELETHKTQLELVIKSTGVGIWDWYVQTGETKFNERWANIIGYTLEELSPVSIETWIKHAHPDDLKESDRLLKEIWAGKTEYYIFESRMKHKNDYWVWVYDTGQVIEWESKGVPKRMIGTHLDITEQKNTQLLLDEANKKLEELVRIDPLSNIANRRAFDERIALELGISRREGKPLSLLMIDIDYFKEYNDIYGHEKGDIIIQRVANQLKLLFREIDFVARYGGDEFIVLLHSTNVNNATLIAEKICHTIASLNIAHKVSRFNQTLTVSIGISSTEFEADNLLKRADEALYTAKENGRNQYHIYANNK
jgi:diguanylate cyclase (GGDEF)-like protein/PAS domain S-box-containing protein